MVIQPSALCAFRHWPEMSREFEENQYNVGMSYKKHSGEHIYGPCPPSFNDPENRVGRLGPYVAPAQSRVRFYRMLLRQVAKLGFRVDYGKRVKDYFEDKLAGKGGVILDNGEILLADIVIAADGLKSRSAILVGGEDLQPKPSGMSIYRAAYPLGYAMKDETVREKWGSQDPVWEFWMGPGRYIGVFLSKDTMSWGFTPRDEGGNPKESWNPDVHPEQALEALERNPGWDPAIQALVRTAPQGSIVHWPLMWRDLRREWTSPGGYIVQIGDSAHSFLPTSGNGATQALEDAVTLATCLQLAGIRNAHLATKIFNLLRYERISCGQKVSFVNAQLKQETDWKAIEQDPIKVRTRFPKWIYQHDPEAYAYEKYGQGFAHLVAGLPFQNTNFPPGHKFVPWTIDEVKEDIANGKRVEDLLDGDWT
jgi:2-polyprenyl-6-methoxyphenol hydroxylase-like FAD-dependent oxidoreductase